MPVSTAAPAVAGARRAFAPAATLFVLAPLIGEVLFGALPLSQLPFGLLGLMGLYGGGALLVRETARRRGLSAWWVVVLGMAYGIFEEGTVVQSLFDQHYRGLDFLGFYGHWTGVNWVWSLFIVPYHAVFSITIPIALAEALYPTERRESWLGDAGLIAIAAIVAANAALLAVFQTHLFTPRAPDVSLAANVVALLVIVAVIAAAYVGPTSSGRPERARSACRKSPAAVVGGVRQRPRVVRGLSRARHRHGDEHAGRCRPRDWGTDPGGDCLDRGTRRVAAPSVECGVDLRARRRRAADVLAAWVPDRRGQRRQPGREPGWATSSSAG